MKLSRITFSAEEIANACGGRVVRGSGRTTAIGVSTDSRKTRRGEAFFALVGFRHDAHRFLAQAAEAGARVLVVQRDLGRLRLPPSCAAVMVEDTTDALLGLAALHRSRLRGKVLAVTGSCGKTTVKDMAAAMLSRHGQCTAAMQSFNNKVGLSTTLLSAAESDDYIVLEMGTNHPGEIDELARCARPHLAVITCIGESHLEGFGSLDGVRDAKAEIIPHIEPDGALVLNADDPLCRGLGERFGGQVLTFGLSVEADVRPAMLRQTGSGYVFRACGCTFSLRVPGLHNLLNAAAALSASVWAGVSPANAAEALANYKLPPLRFEFHTIAGVRFVEDCYNSNPTALRAALRSFLNEPVDGRMAMVCGDMLELGEHAARLHAQMGKELATSKISLLVAVGPLGPHLLEGWQQAAGPDQQAMHFQTAEEAWAPLWEWVRRGDSVLVKASRGMGLERIRRYITNHLAEKRETAA